LRDNVARFKQDVNQLKRELMSVDAEDSIRRSTMEDEVEAAELHMQLMKKKATAAEKALGVKAQQ
jgi:hypothetical protein